MPQRDSNPGPPGRQSNALTHSANTPPFDIPDPTTTLHLLFSYIASIFLRPTSASGTPIYLTVAIGIFLGTVSMSFSRSTKAKAMFPCLSNFLSTSCLGENVKSTVLRTFLKPCCYSPNPKPLLSSSACGQSGNNLSCYIYHLSTHFVPSWCSPFFHPLFIYLFIY